MLFKNAHTSTTSVRVLTGGVHGLGRGADVKRMRRLLRGVAVVFVTTLLGTVTAAPAGAAGEKAIWGGLSLPNGKSAFPTYKDLGVDVFQYQLSWAKTAPTKPTQATNPADPAYVWPSGVQLAIDRATGSDMTVALLVKETPGWANANAGVTKAPTSRRPTRTSSPPLAASTPP